MLPSLIAMAGAETVLAFCIASNATPLVKLGQQFVDVVRRNRLARALAKTVAGTLVIRLASEFSSALKSQRRIDRSADGHASATSQSLEVALISFILVLALVVSSLDLSLKRFDALKREADALKKRLKGAEAEYLRVQDELNSKATENRKALVAEVKSQKEIIFELRQKLEQVQVDANSKEKELKSLTANLKALDKQTEGFQNEYARVVDDNENLRTQLSLFDRKYSASGNKKNS